MTAINRKDLDRLMRAHKFSAKTRAAIRLCLLDGIGLSEAARRSGLKHRQSVYRSVRKMQCAMYALLRKEIPDSGSQQSQEKVVNNRGDHDDDARNPVGSGGESKNVL